MAFALHLRCHRAPEARRILVAELPYAAGQRVQVSCVVHVHPHDRVMAPGPQSATAEWQVIKFAGIGADNRECFSFRAFVVEQGTELGSVWWRVMHLLGARRRLPHMRHDSALGETREALRSASNMFGWSNFPFISDRQAASRDNLNTAASLPSSCY